MREKKFLFRENKGATAVEGALVISVLIFLTFGIIEFGMALWAWNTMGLAVQDAGRYVMINNASATVQADAINLMQTILATAPGTVSTTCTTPTADQICLSASTTAGTPSLMTLTAAYGFKVIGLSPTYTLTSQATFPMD
jgi:Flp pilus assembly protein TadG